MKRDQNYGRETNYKVVKEFVERKNRANYYHWQCKICNGVFGPTALANILHENRVGICCKKKISISNRNENYSNMVGTLITPTKKLVEYTGYDDGEFPHPHFEYMCTICEKRYGPAPLNSIQYYEKTQCCGRESKYEVEGYGVISNSRIRRVYHAAYRRGFECNLTAEYLDSLWGEQQARCAYSGANLETPDLGSIDRIDSSKGYVIGNVQWVLREVNVMKLDMSEDRFLELCSMITNRQKEKENDDSK